MSESMIKFRYGHIRVFLGIYNGIQAISSRFKIKNAPLDPLKKSGVRTGLNRFEPVRKIAKSEPQSAPFSGPKPSNTNAPMLCINVYGREACHDHAGAATAWYGVLLPFRNSVLRSGASFFVGVEMTSSP